MWCHPLLFYLDNKKLNHLLGCFCSLNRNNFIFLLISFIYKVKIFIQKIKYLIKLNWNIKWKNQNKLTKLNRPTLRTRAKDWPGSGPDRLKRRADYESFSSSSNQCQLGLARFGLRQPPNGQHCSKRIYH